MLTVTHLERDLWASHMVSPGGAIAGGGSISFPRAVIRDASFWDRARYSERQGSCLEYRYGTVLCVFGFAASLP